MLGNGSLRELFRLSFFFLVVYTLKNTYRVLRKKNHFENFNHPEKHYWSSLEHQKHTDPHFGQQRYYSYVQRVDHTYTVEPRPVDNPPLWTPHHCGHFLPGPFVFLIYGSLFRQFCMIRGPWPHLGSLVWTPR